MISLSSPVDKARRELSDALPRHPSRCLLLSPEVDDVVGDVSDIVSDSRLLCVGESHRFTVAKALEYEGKVRGALRHVRDNAPDALSVRTVLVTRTGWPYDDAGRPAPPVEYLRALQDGRDAFLRALRRVLDDTRAWGRVTVREPHEDGGRRPGFPHAHDGIVVVGDVTETDVRPALDACSAVRVSDATVRRSIYYSVYPTPQSFTRECGDGNPVIPLSEAVEYMQEYPWNFESALEMIVDEYDVGIDDIDYAPAQ